MANPRGLALSAVEPSGAGGCLYSVSASTQQGLNRAVTGGSQEPHRVLLGAKKNGPEVDPGPLQYVNRHS